MDSDILQHAIKELAALTLLEYESVRKQESKKLSIRTSVLDEAVMQERNKNKSSSESDEGLGLSEAEPWPEPVDGQEMYKELVNTFNKYLVLQKHQAEALALWSIFSYNLDACNIAPKLLIYSPEKRCGKTTLLDVLIGLVWKAIPASNITPAVIFRVIQKYGGTIVIDEADTFLKNSPELNGIINSGHRKSSAFVMRCEADTHEPMRFSTWSPNIIAMIGKPADTIVDRSILIEMKRKKPGDKAERFIPSKVESELARLASKIARWSKDNYEPLCNSDPETPEGLNDRASDNWRPLLAIADHVGGGCPDSARQAAISLAGIEDDEENTSRGVLLLSDIREVFSSTEEVRLPSFELVSKLCGLEDSPWAEWNRGNEVTPRQIVRLLKPYGIQSKKFRFGCNTANGYEKVQFTDAFERYLSGTTEQTNVANELDCGLNGTDAEHVLYDDLPKALNNIDCSSVPSQDNSIPF